MSMMLKVRLCSCRQTVGAVAAHASGNNIPSFESGMAASSLSFLTRWSCKPGKRPPEPSWKMWSKAQANTLDSVGIDLETTAGTADSPSKTSRSTNELSVATLRVALLRPTTRRRAALRCAPQRNVFTGENNRSFQRSATLRDASPCGATRRSATQRNVFTKEHQYELPSLRCAPLRVATLRLAMQRNVLPGETI